MNIEQTNIGTSIETVSGKLIDPSNPDIDNISITDIAWSLSRIPRFAGHTITEIPYNVAQHSIYVAELIGRLMSFEPDILEMVNDSEVSNAISSCASKYPKDSARLLGLQLYGLLHDAHEAYFGDIPSPIKKIPALNSTFKMLESKLDSAIRAHLKIADPDDNEKLIIKFCDKMAQAIEGYQFMPSRGKNWVLPRPTLIMLQKFPEPMAPLKSYKAFLDTFEYLRS